MPVKSMPSWLPSHLEFTVNGGISLTAVFLDTTTVYWGDGSNTAYSAGSASMSHSYASLDDYKLSFSPKANVEEIHLNSSATGLTKVNVSGFPSLVELWVTNSPDVVSINASHCPLLSDFTTYGTLTELVSINLSYTPSMYSLNMDNPGDYVALTSIDFTNCGFELLWIDLDAAATVDFTGCTNLTTIWADNWLAATSVDLSPCSGLEDIYAYNWPEATSIILPDPSSSLIAIYLEFFPELTSLDVSGQSNLEILSLNFVEVASLSVGALSDLTTLALYYCPVSTVSVSSNSALVDIALWDLPNFTSLDVSANSLLERIDLISMPIPSIDISGLNNLVDISINDSCTSMTTFDTSDTSALLYLTLRAIPSITTVLFHASTVLNSISLYQMTSLATIDLSSQTDLEAIGISAIYPSLSITASSELTYFSAEDLLTSEVDSIAALLYSVSASRTVSGGSISFGSSCEGPTGPFNSGGPSVGAQYLYHLQYVIDPSKRWSYISFPTPV